MNSLLKVGFNLDSPKKPKAISLTRQKSKTHTKTKNSHQRSSSLYSTPVNKKANINFTSTGPNLGPGKYNTFTNNRIMGFEFSRCERFDNFDSLAKVSLFKKLNEFDKQKILERINKNKEEAIIPASTKAKTAETKARQHSLRLEVSRLTKKRILMDKKTRYSNSIEEKFKKYEYRLKINVKSIQEIAEIKKSWILLETIMAVSYIAKSLIRNKKSLRLRSYRLLSKIKLLSTFIGKIMLKIKRNKNIRSLKILRMFFKPYVQLWIKHRRNRNKKIIMQIIEKKLSESMLVSLISNWLDKILKIQRIVKHVLFFKFSMYKSLILKWNNAEVKMFQQTVDKDPRRRRRTVSIKIMKDKELENGHTTIPRQIKLYYIRRVISERLNVYLNEYRDYKAQFKAVHQHNLRNRWNGSEDSVLEYPLRPTNSFIYDHFTEDKFEELIKKALKDRTDWSSILAIEEAKLKTLKMQS